MSQDVPPLLLMKSVTENVPITSVAFCPTAPLLATGSTAHSNGATLWKLKKGTNFLRRSYNWDMDGRVNLNGHTGVVSSVAFHPTANPPLLATGSFDTTVKLWRFSSDGSNATCVVTLAGHSSYVYSVAFHHTMPLLATGSWDNTARLWLLSHDNLSATFVATLAGHSNNVTSVAFHPTAPLLATGSWDKTAKLWLLSSDNSSATCVATLKGHRNWVTSVAFHPTMPLLATGSDDTTVRLWRLYSESGEWSATFVATLDGSLHGHTKFVNSVAFHPTAPLLATGSDDNTVRLWVLSPETFYSTRVAILREHTGYVRSVAFHPTEPLMATGSEDKTVKLWKIKDIFDKLSTPRITPTPPITSKVITSQASSPGKASNTDYHRLPGGGSIIRHHKKRSSRKLKRYASKRIKRNRNRNRNKYRKSKKAKTKRYRKLR
jgi:WD40 repeat protein